MVLFRPLTLDALDATKTELNQRKATIRNAHAHLKNRKREIWDRRGEVQREIESLLNVGVHFMDTDVQDLVSERAELRSELNGLDGEAQREINEQGRAAGETLRLIGTFLHLVFIQDRNENAGNAALNFYTGDGTPIFEAGDAENITAMVVTSHLRARTLHDFRADTQNFSVPFETRTYVTLAEIDGENCIVLWYTSGNYFVVRNHLGITRMNYFDYVWNSAGFIQA
jgi:hypothetical protein